MPYNVHERIAQQANAFLRNHCLVPVEQIVSTSARWRVVSNPVGRSCTLQEPCSVQIMQKVNGVEKF